MSGELRRAEMPIAEVASRFQMEGVFAGASPYGSGHINGTFRAAFLDSGVQKKYILQRINRNVFKNPGALMRNIQRVTAHLAAKVSGLPGSDRHVLTLIPASDGQAFYIDPTGDWWRAYRFLENARTYDAAESPEQTYQAAFAFGHFQRMLVDLPSPRLEDTIPDFHHTPKRLAALERAIAADAVNRVAQAREEIDFVLARKELAGILLQAGLPERITHNDTKFNNVMLDDATGEGICVIDLDTVMPGLALYDFGDMVRTTTSPAQEDERDLARVTMRFPFFEGLLRGYLASAGGFLTTAETQHLVGAGKVITFEQAIRFLTDYLAGDVYYKVHRDGHNLDRCRTQLRLLESIERQEPAMEQLVLSLIA